MFLYESWANSSSDVNLNGYVSFNFFRKFQHKKARRNSGGIAIYIKEELADGIKIVKNHFDTIIWLKLDHLFFNISEDFYICATYVWGHESPVYNTFNVDLFEILENDITYFSEFGKIFVVGDLNSRVGNKFDYIVHDIINTVYDDADYCPDNTSVRASVDSSINSHGVKLLDLCKSTCLRIANGRVGNSCKQTFYSNNGTSVIYYLLATEYSFSSIYDFTVHDFTNLAITPRYIFHYYVIMSRPITSHSPMSSINGTMHYVGNFAHKLFRCYLFLIPLYKM